MKSHVVDYEILGDDLQFVEVELDPSETVIAEAGMMMYMEDGINFETKMGDGSKPKAGFLDKVVSVGKRALTGESLFMTHFSHTGGEGKRHVAFGAPYPGKVILFESQDCDRKRFVTARWGWEHTLTNLEIIPMPGRYDELMAFKPYLTIMTEHLRNRLKHA